MAGLHFGAGIDTSQFSRDVKKMRQEILGLKKEGEDIDFSDVLEQIRIQKEVISGLEEEYAKVGKQIKGMAPGNAQLKLISEHKKIGVELKNEKKALEDLETVYKSFANEQTRLTTKQREVRNQLRELASQGKENTDEYRELTEQLREYDKAIDAVNAQQRIMKQGGAGMQVLVGSIRAASGAFTGITGVMGLLNDNTERYQELQTRLQSVMSISIGIEQTYRTLLKEGNLIQAVRAIQMRASAKATQLQTSSTIGATVAQKALNKAANANPYVLLASLILSVAGAYLLFSKRTKEASKELAELKKQFVETSTTAGQEITRIGMLRAEIENLNVPLKNRNEAIKELREMYPDILKGLTDEEILAGNVAGAYDQITDAIIENTKQRAISAQMEEKWGQFVKDNADQVLKLARNRAELERLQNLSPDQTISRSTVSGANVPEGAERSERLYVGAVIDRIKENNEKIEKALKDGQKPIQEEMDSLLSLIDFSKTRTGNSPEKTVEKNVKEALDDTLKLWNDYYNAVALLGKQEADKLYGDIINVDSSQLEELKKQRDEFLSLEDPTREQIAFINVLESKIRELQGLKSPFEEQKKSIISVTDEMEDYNDKIEYLSRIMRGLGDEGMDIELKAALKEEQDKIIEERQKTLDSLLESQKDYDEKVKDINKKYQQFLDDQNLSEEQKTKLKLARDKELYDALFESLKNNPKFAEAFVNMNRVATKSLRELRAIMVRELTKAKNDADKIKLGEFIDKLDKTIKSRKLFQAIIEAVQALGKESGKTKDELKDLTKEAGIEIVDYANTLSGLVGDVEGIADDLGLSLDNSFGDVLDKIKGVVEGIGQIGEGLQTMSKGDPISVVAGGIKVLDGIVKSVSSLFNNDRKRDRAIKRHLEAVRQLQSAYRDLEFQIDRAFGERKVKNQLEQVKNLRAQQANLIAAINKEERNKHTDRGKIEEWNEQIKEIDRSIKELFETIQNEALNTDALTVAERMGDILKNSFETGSDAAKDFGKVVDDIFEGMVRKKVLDNIMPKLEGGLDTLFTYGGYDEFDPENIPDWLIDKYRDGFQKIGEEAKKQYDAMMELFGMSPFEDITNKDPDQLRGAIQGMNQQTADILAGQFNAIRMDTSEMAKIIARNENVFNNLLAVMYAIKDDTSNLVQMRKDLSELNSKVSSNDIRSSGL